MKEIRRLLSC
uniref:Uncharacterized protein n=1 Tax=Rhizophora mucronata TaxID=61149 RepID=A0A2P2QJC9_RHIMU